MRPWRGLGGAIALAIVLLGKGNVRAVQQAPALLAVDEQVLRDYTGVYQWESGGFVYLQLWAELIGANQLVAFEESGELRALYPTEHDRFFAGPGAAMPTAVESRVEFQRERGGKISGLTWRREGGATRTARRVDRETRDEVHFSNGGVKLAGTLIRPAGGGKSPAIILVPAAGAEDRDYVLPLAHFLVRRGVAVLGYDKRGVGGSSGDWNKASYDDLAGDVVAAFDYLKGRRDIDRTQIGLLGWSQAGWVMPIVAARAKELAFLISVSGDPAPTLQQLQVPTLALFGELDTNIGAEKNKAAWEAALQAGGNRDYTLRILAKANHLQLEAKTGSTQEMTSLQRFVPEYFSTVDDWMSKHVRGLEAAH